LRVREEKRAAYAKVLADSDTPLLTRQESTLAVARANLALAYANFEKTRIRAPRDGTILKIDVEKGEILGPSRPEPAIIMGDVSKLRIRTEVAERDVASVFKGQSVSVNSEAFLRQSFDGRVSDIAGILGRTRITDASS